MNKKIFDKKPDYNYNPHGSIPPSKAPKGSVVPIAAHHVDTQGRVTENVPDACIVP